MATNDRRNSNVLVALRTMVEEQAIAQPRGKITKTFGDITFSGDFDSGWSKRAKARTLLQQLMSVDSWM